MKVNILKSIRHDRLGRLAKGQVVDIMDFQAQFFIERGEAERYETKVIRERPLPVVGSSLSASPAAQALPEQTSEPSASGKKRGRPKKNVA